MEGLKKTTASAQLIRVFEILIYQIKWLSSKVVDVAIKNNAARLWVSFKVYSQMPNLIDRRSWSTYSLC